MVSLSNYGLSVEGNIVLSNTRQLFFAKNSFGILQSSCHNNCVNFWLIYYIQFTDMPDLNRYDIITSENCGTQTTEWNIVGHMKRRSVGIFIALNVPVCQQRLRLTWINTELRNIQEWEQKTQKKLNISFEECSGVFAVRKQMSSQHGIPIRTSNLETYTLLEDIGHAELKEEPKLCNDFLVDSAFEERRHRLFSFALPTSNNSFLNKQLDHVINQLNFQTCARICTGKQWLWNM